MATYKQVVEGILKGAKIKVISREVIDGRRVLTTKEFDRKEMTGLIAEFKKLGAKKDKYFGLAKFARSVHEYSSDDFAVEFKNPDGEETFEKTDKTATLTISFPVLSTKV